MNDNPLPTQPSDTLPTHTESLRQSSTQSRSSHFAVGGALVGVMVLIDQIIKWFIAVPLALESRVYIDILPILRFTWAENCGVALSLFAVCSNENRWILVAVTAIITLIIAVWMSRTAVRAEALALAFIVGGALGNIADRLLHGYVIDYIDLHFGNLRPFFIFNFADIAITCGAVLLLWCEFRPRRSLPDSSADLPPNPSTPKSDE